MIDGGVDACPSGLLHAWLLTDDRAELAGEIRRLASRRGMHAGVQAFAGDHLSIEPRSVTHTNHPAYGYLIRWRNRRVVWAPEFWRFPRWAASADLMFAEAAGWNRPIQFRGGVGGHLDALAVSRAARAWHVRRLIFAHIGRPTLAAIDRGERPPFGTFGRDGQRFTIRSTPTLQNGGRGGMPRAARR